MLLGVARRRQTWAVIRATRGDVCWERNMNAQEGTAGTGQGDMCHRCASTGVRAPACTLSGQAGSPCTPVFPVTLLGCLSESHV